VPKSSDGDSGQFHATGGPGCRVPAGIAGASAAFAPALTPAEEEPPPAVEPAMRDARVLAHINAEFARSKGGGFRRLFPSERGKQYEQYLPEHHTMHRLPFEL